MRQVLAALAGVVLFACAGYAHGPEATSELKVAAIPADLRPDRLDGLRLRWAASLTADHPFFGGFSGLLVEAGRLTAVSDRGWWLTVPFDDGPAGIRLRPAALTPMQGEDGQAFDKTSGDAEALTLRDGRIVVAFERDHRLMVQREDGRLDGAVRDRLFRVFTSNKGIEALATTATGDLLAFGEARANGGLRMFAIRHDDMVEMTALATTGPHFATGADVGPDGRLYLLLRDYSPLFGVSVRIHRYDLGQDGFPIAESLKVMAEFNPKSGIDNMEGIALWRDAAGATRLTLISDDNFSPLQRTLLLDLEVLE